MYLCKVCKSGEIKFGIDFCEACRSFHKRHRNRIDFQCRSGTNDCMKPSNSNKQPRRPLCQKCRIESCRRIKMALPFTKNKYSINSLMKAPLEMEQLLCKIQSASSMLMENFDKMETRQLNEWPFRSAQESYNALANNCQSKIVKLKEFSRQFDFFNKLTVSDRAVLFLTSRFKVFCGENLLHPEGAYIVDFKINVALQGRHLYPHIWPCVEQAGKSWNDLNNLNLDRIEKSFFLAFLHFGIVPAAMSSKGKRQLSKSLKQMKNCLETYLVTKYKNDNWKQHSAIFYQAVDRVGEEALWRSQVVKTIVIPTFHHGGPTLFTSINNDGPEEYLTALKHRTNNEVLAK